MEDYRYDDHDHHEYDDDDTMSHADAADTSSHHGHDDDVFSDNNSPRSSMGSVSEGDPRKAAHHDGLRSPRISDIQQQYDDAPRSSLRSASSSAGKAAQHAAASSPAGQPQPRSGRRSALPTVSRLGSASPNPTAQYSPKKTPPRFKKNDPPLVLLHVTLLPLRWCWGDVLDDAKTSELSEGVKTLREAWRQLQDTIGDTIQDRGVLLPHPQDDFEAMEERLLEALELPFKRRARILECGHYLGPSNEMPFADEEEEDDDDIDADAYDEDAPPRAPVPEKQTHWCSTCHCEIRFDALGAGKIYRVKVYASNGLLRAGAWEACWKEMERVDIEIEPMMDAKLQDELVRLAARQDRVIHSKSRADRRPLSSRVQDVEDERESEEDLDADETMGQESFMPQDGSTPRTSFEGYGDTYRSKSRQASGRASRSSRPSMGFAHTDTFGQHKKQQQRSRFAAGSFPDMVVNAFKALLDDKRNLAILLLSVLTVAVAVRGGVSNRFYDDIVTFQQPVLTESSNFETPTTVVSDHVGEDGQPVQVEVGVEGDGDVSFSPTSAVVEILLTPQAKADGENPCAAMEPQTVEKWLTATVTERTTVARTDMPDADDDVFTNEDGEEEANDEGFEGAKDSDGVHYLDGLPGEEDAGEQQQTTGQTDWEWGTRFKFPW
ncbi:hypothetical protein BBK36DRAFT_1161643 [Trichoderma citrinoviride]|uniref:Pathway-specific nitrogen regulator n=1 Tax=Trichoderma citrinoviride TaxID=58853 RepID=A0A2T4B2Y1_9HYPO|nr:hypothetical protein BBK36DRAFT_1161643 [Trichoderma citrinoviride]PTB63693.1 hypothetical protein BBK36DRAFT_1161643 [Trichoderma citrinoviride]